MTYYCNISDWQDGHVCMVNIVLRAGGAEYKKAPRGGGY